MNEQDADYETEFSENRNFGGRREKSRSAAQNRRENEANVFMELKKVVPYNEEATSNTNRLALLRVATVFCRIREFATQLWQTDDDEEQVEVMCERTLLESLHGFLVIVDQNGIILYVTESVSFYLGLTQTDLTGYSLREFVHAKDYNEFETYGTEDTYANEKERLLTLRMKCLIGIRGRNLTLKKALLKPVTCYVRSLRSTIGRVQLVVAITQPPGNFNSSPLSTNSAQLPCCSYMSRHTCDMKILYASKGFNDILHHEGQSVLGTSFYNLVYPSDLEVLMISFREMFVKGHIKTPYYRLIGINQSVLWVQTEATTMIHTSKEYRGKYVVCVHDVLGSQTEIDSFIGAENHLMNTEQEKGNTAYRSTNESIGYLAGTQAIRNYVTGTDNYVYGNHSNNLCGRGVESNQYTAQGSGAGTNYYERAVNESLCGTLHYYQNGIQANPQFYNNLTLPTVSGENGVHFNSRWVWDQSRSPM